MAKPIFPVPLWIPLYVSMNTSFTGYILIGLSENDVYRYTHELAFLIFGCFLPWIFMRQTLILAG